MQDKLANITSTTIQSGISSPLGIATVLKGGAFLNNTLVEEQENVQKQIEKTLAIRILVDILRTQVCYNIELSQLMNCLLNHISHLVTIRLIGRLCYL